MHLIGGYGGGGECVNVWRREVCPQTTFTSAIKKIKCPHLFILFYFL